MSNEEAAAYLDQVWSDVFDDKSFFLKGTKHPVEYYFMTPEVTENTDNVGLYDVMTDVWVKPPVEVPKDFDIEDI